MCGSEIIHGVFIEDTQHLLIGDQKYKRYVKIDSFDIGPVGQSQRIDRLICQF